jgi:hypothetical protein
VWGLRESTTPVTLDPFANGFQSEQDVHALSKKEGTTVKIG